MKAWLALLLVALPLTPAIQDPVTQEPAVGLAVTDPAPEVALGLAIWEARLGDATGALARVAGLLNDAEGSFAERLALERSRLEAWRALRDQYLEGLVESGKRLTLLDGEKKVRVVVKRIEERVLYLAKNKSGWEQVPVCEIPAGDLAQQMARAGDGTLPAWSRMYGFIVAENDKWEKLLKDDDPESAALRLDAEHDYPGRLRVGQCATMLNALAASPPTDSAMANDALEQIESLRALGAELEFVQARRAALRAQAATAYSLLFEESGPGSILKGEYTELGDGRARLHYGFDEEGELEDFIALSDHMKFHRKRFSSLEEGFKNKFWIKGGALRGEGEAALRLRLEFAAPMTVEYDLVVDRPQSEGAIPFYFFLGIVDDGDYRFAWCSSMGDLEVWNTRSDVRQDLAGARDGIVLGQSYFLKITHDGEKVSTERDREELANLECLSKEGSIFLWMHSGMRISVRRITIEGRLDPASVDALREAWVEEQLADF